MDAQHQISTVAADQRGGQTRKYESADATSRLPALATLGAHVVVVAVMIKKLFWPSAEAATAPSDPPPVPVDEEDSSHVSATASDCLPDTEANVCEPSSSDELADDGLPDAPVARRSGSAAVASSDADGGGEPDQAPATGRPDGVLPSITGFRDPTPRTAMHGGPALDIDFDGGTPVSSFAFSSPVRVPGNDNFEHDLVGTTLPAATPDVTGAPLVGPDGEIIVPQKPIAPAASEDEDLRRMNRAPVLASTVVLADLAMNQSLLIGLSDLLANASDPDGDTLTVSGLTASSGTLLDLGNGTWRFTPERDDTSDVVFRYAVGDGEVNVMQTATLDLLPEEALANVIVGTPGDDVIVTRAGSVTVEGLAGDDLIETGAGDDVIHGEDGRDVIFAGGGDDIVVAGRGNDLVFGGAGDDVISGGEGNDVLFGETGNDRIAGDGGDDVVDGGAGNDVVEAGAGDDIVIASLDDGDDVYDGGTGSDTYDASAATAGITVDLTAGTASGAETGNDRLASIENVIGGAGDDVVTGNAAANFVATGAGDDTIVASLDDADDVYDGGTGSDTYDASAATAGITVDLTAGTASGAETGNDRLASIENVIGGAGDDTIIDSAATNVLTGGGGSDTFVFGNVDTADGVEAVRDVVADFQFGDRIDVSRIDADQSNDGHQSFTLSIDAVDSGSKRGLLKFRFEQEGDGEHTLIRGYIDDDDLADLIIDLIGRYDLTEADFKLDWDT